jgi:hypothetical protein
VTQGLLRLTRAVLPVGRGLASHVTTGSRWSNQADVSEVEDCAEPVVMNPRPVRGCAGGAHLRRSAMAGPARRRVDPRRPRPAGRPIRIWSTGSLSRAAARSRSMSDGSSVVKTVTVTVDGETYGALRRRHVRRGQRDRLHRPGAEDRRRTGKWRQHRRGRDRGPHGALITANSSWPRGLQPPATSRYHHAKAPPHTRWATASDRGEMLRFMTGASQGIVRYW